MLICSMRGLLLLCLTVCVGVASGKLTEAIDNALSSIKTVGYVDPSSTFPLVHFLLLLVVKQTPSPCYTRENAFVRGEGACTNYANSRRGSCSRKGTEGKCD